MCVQLTFSNEIGETVININAGTQTYSSRNNFSLQWMALQVSVIEQQRVEWR